MRRLIELLGAIPCPESMRDMDITGITTNSAHAKPGTIFVALRGAKMDGVQFIPQAEKHGAVLAICAINSTIPEHTIHVLQVENPRVALAHMAAAFYGAQPEHVVAVTGTDGKTSTADFYRQLMQLAGKRSASMGTLGVISGEGKNLYPGTLTTPDAVEIQRILAELAHHNIQHLAMEASSHGLHQHRLDGVKLQAAAFTNIARDHLDYHHTEEEYFLAKARLFTDLLPAGRTAVLNQDDARFPALQAICKGRNQQVIGFGYQGEQFTIKSITPHPHGQRVVATLFGKSYDIDVPLVGAFQVMNILAALGLAEGNVEDYLAHIPQLKGVPGRLEQVAALRSGAGIFIDYAHTPMALANILNTLRPHTQGKLHVVFGCGGDRDAGKRALMGKAACELADEIIVTDDNPRSENPAAIRAAIMAGAPGAKEVAERGEAIYRAVKQLSAGDVLVIAGKGHEKTQIIGSEQIPFDDAEVARQAALDL